MPLRQDLSSQIVEPRQMRTGGRQGAEELLPCRSASLHESKKSALRLLSLLCVCVIIAALGSHFVATFLKIRTSAVGYKLLANGNQKPFALAEGSSLMLDGLSWRRISNAFGQNIENWFVAGSSPSEWESLQGRASDARLTFIVVSAYDLNEHFICDYRAAVVPLNRSMRDLWQSGADWPFTKRLLSQYPLQYLRYLFPTLGRSDGVMVGIREKLSEILRPWFKIEAEAGPTVGSDSDATSEEIKTGKVTDWSKARMLRRLTLMRNACQGKHSFNGPKNLAFLRMLQRAQQKGRVVVVVLPVSPIYTQEFLTPEASRQFEDVLADLERRVPQANWIHLEGLAELNSNEYFQDFVHMNVDGQRIATDTFLTRIRAAGVSVRDQ
jgi:hypothetical protein